MLDHWSTRNLIKEMNNKNVDQLVIFPTSKQNVFQLTTFTLVSASRNWISDEGSLTTANCLYTPQQFIHNL
jgi:hypothetical protein